MGAMRYLDRRVILDTTKSHVKRLLGDEWKVRMLRSRANSRVTTMGQCTGSARTIAVSWKHETMAELLDTIFHEIAHAQCYEEWVGWLHENKFGDPGMPEGPGHGPAWSRRYRELCRLNDIDIDRRYLV